MKKKKMISKQLLSILCMVVFIIMFSGCSQTNNTQMDSSQEIENKDTITSTAEDYLSAWNDLDIDSVFEQYEDQLGNEEKALYQSWKDIKDQIGAYKEISDKSYSKTDDNTTIVTLHAQYEKKSIDFSVSIDSSGQITEQPSVEIYTTMSEKLQKAGINTVMSIAIVFIVLMFISFIIYLLKYVPGLLGLEKKDTAPVMEAAPVVEKVEEENLTDDTELVAVITAAIMASMGSEAPADGLMISSIKRRTSNKWKRR